MNGFPEKILLATDGLEGTTLAARAAVDLAAKGGSELHVVHVWHDIHTTHFHGYVKRELHEWGRGILDEQVKKLEEMGASVSGAHLREGQEVEVILAQAEEIDAGLIIVGSRGMGRLGRLALGSVSMGLAHRSRRPVLIVREGEAAWPPERVLVGYGSFEDTKRAGTLGASLGRALGAEVELVGVESGGDGAEEKTHDIERTLQARADEIEGLVGQRPKVRTLVGDVPEAILGPYAGEEGPVLLSFGSKVLGRAGRVLVGEALDRVLSQSKGPILVTPEPYETKARLLTHGEAEGLEGPAVLVATDGSEVSLRSAEYAARLASGLGAKLFALYVVDEDLTFRSGLHYGDFVERLSEDGRESTGKVRELAEKSGVGFEELIVLGDPARTIVAVAEELGAEPVVLGSEGKSTLAHALIGSVSEEVLRHANRTVLVVGGRPEPSIEPGR